MISDDKYYEIYRDLFVTEGWKQYVEEAKESLESLELKSCKDWDSFLVMKTKIGMLDSIVNFEQLILTSEKLVEEGKELEIYNDSL